MSVLVAHVTTAACVLIESTSSSVYVLTALLEKDVKVVSIHHPKICIRSSMTLNIL